MRAGRPRVIRKVVRKNKTTGAPKIARDYRTRIQMEAVKAMVSRPCAYHDCLLLIEPGTLYVKVLRPQDRKGKGPYYRAWPDPKNYHFGCVPPEARPLVRFLQPPP